MFTQLKNRKLWYDGISSYDGSQLDKLLTQVEVKWVDNLTEDIEIYNRIIPKAQRIQIKTTACVVDPTWNPEISKITLPMVLDFISDKHAVITALMSDEQASNRELRLSKELNLFISTPGMMDILKSIIYVVNKLTISNQVWGVGRGSSVSSYALYVIGAHDVDSYAYGLDISDFIPSTKQP